MRFSLLVLRLLYLFVGSFLLLVEWVCSISLSENSPCVLLNDYLVFFSMILPNFNFLSYPDPLVCVYIVEEPLLLFFLLHFLIIYCLGPRFQFFSEVGFSLGLLLLELFGVFFCLLDNFVVLPLLDEVSIVYLGPAFFVLELF